MLLAFVIINFLSLSLALFFRKPDPVLVLLFKSPTVVWLP